MRPKKTLEKILAGAKNIRFQDMVLLLEAFGFELVRTNGSHNIFKHQDVVELINIQNVNGQVKHYQIRQFLKLVEKYSLLMN